jgi:hypothetical protein
MAKSMATRKSVTWFLKQRHKLIQEYPAPSGLLHNDAIATVQANVRKRILRAFVARGHTEPLQFDKYSGELVLTPLELINRIAQLVPPPRTGHRCGMSVVRRNHRNRARVWRVWRLSRTGRTRIWPTNHSPTTPTINALLGEFAAMGNGSRRPRWGRAVSVDSPVRGLRWVGANSDGFRRSFQGELVFSGRFGMRYLASGGWRCPIRRCWWQAAHLLAAGWRCGEGFRVSGNRLQADAERPKC